VLYRQILACGHDCQVVAPSLIPKTPGERVKTDRRDALKLARLLRSGDLTAVWVPGEEQEQMRDLSRARDDMKAQERKARQQLNAFLLRHGHHWPRDKSRWTLAHESWLAELKMAQPWQQVVLEEYIQAERAARGRVAQLTDHLLRALPEWSLAPQVEQERLDLVVDPEALQYREAHGEQWHEREEGRVDHASDFADLTELFGFWALYFAAAARARDAPQARRRQTGSRPPRRAPHQDSRCAGAERRVRCAPASAPNRLPSPRLGPWRRCILRQPGHPRMHILGSVHLAGSLEVGVGSQRLLDEAAHLLFVRGVPLDRLDNQTVRRAAGLFGKCIDPGT